MKIWIHILFGLLLIGCNRSPKRITSPSELGNELAEVACQRLFECYPDGQDDFSSEHDCQRLFGGVFSILEAPLKQGLVSFDGDSALSCLTDSRQQIRHTSCQDLDGFKLDLSAECGAIFTAPQNQSIGNEDSR